MAEKAFDYARCSGIDDESVESQRRVCAEYAHSHGYEIPADRGYHYEDDHVSGARRDRRGLDQLLKDVVMKRIGPEGTDYVADALIMRDSARLWRGFDPRFPMYFEFVLHEAGIKVLYTDVAQHVDYSGEMGDVEVTTFIGRCFDIVMNAKERSKLRDKFRNKKRELVLDRFYPAGNAPYGLQVVLIDRRTREVVRELQPGETVKVKGCRNFLRIAAGEPAEVVRQIYAKILAGQSLHRIATELNTRGLPSPGEKLWTHKLIADMARHPLYCGDLVWGGYRGYERARTLPAPVPYTAATQTGIAPILYRDFMDERLVDRETWDAVQRVLDGIQALWSKRRASQPKYLLTGKIVCADCGCLLHGTRGTAQPPHPAMRYIHSPGYLDRYRSCPAVGLRLDAKVLEPAVTQAVRVMVLDPETGPTVMRMLKESIETESARTGQSARTALERRIKALDKKVCRAAEAELAATGSLRAKFSEIAIRLGLALDACKADLRELEGGAAKLEAALDARFDFACNPDVLASLLDGSWADQRRVLELVLDSVRVYGAENRAEIRIRMKRTSRAT